MPAGASSEKAGRYSRPDGKRAGNNRLHLLRRPPQPRRCCPGLLGALGAAEERVSRRVKPFSCRNGNDCEGLGPLPDCDQA